MPPRFSLKVKSASSHMDGIASHVAQLRHLTRADALARVLEERHRFAAEKARNRAREIAPHIQQALEFHEASRGAPLRARSVLQYYSYLNLAVSVVQAYEPPNWQNVRAHGAEDLTRELQTVNIDTPVVRVREGALNRLHRVVSGAELPRQGLSLRDLFAAIPMISTEFMQVARVTPVALSVSYSTDTRGEAPAVFVQPRCIIGRERHVEESATPAGADEIPLDLVYTAMPLLKQQFEITSKSAATVVFHTRAKWPKDQEEDAVRFMDETALQLVNFSGQSTVPGQSTSWSWRMVPGSAVLPTLTASLLLTFVLASLTRYRATLLDDVEGTELGLLYEVFAAESDGFVIPAFRNLLFAEVVSIVPVACG